MPEPDASTTSKKPSQARSTATYAGILSAATDIVVERGVKDLNTNLVAERAGINVGTLYHYFPNKAAILAELFRVQKDLRDVVLHDAFAEFSDARGVRHWTSHLFVRIGRLRSEHPTMPALRRAFNSVPELARLDGDAHERYAKLLTGQLARRYASLDALRAKAAAHLVTTLTLGVLDDHASDVEPFAAYVDEVTRLIGAYVDELDR